MVEIIVEELEVNILEKIKNIKEKDKEVVRIAEKMKKTDIKNLRENEWKI